MFGSKRSAVVSVSGAGIAALLGASASAQSNIEVRIENQIIPSFQQFVFPGTAIGASVPQVVVIRNIGNQNLTFTQNPPLALDGAFPGHFELVQPPLESGNLLSPNGSTAFLVRFKPTQPALNPSAFVRIFTNDPDTPLFSLGVQGSVLLPELALFAGGSPLASNSQFTFAPTTVGQLTTRVISILNLGDLPLTINGAPEITGFGASAFQVSGVQTMTIAPGDFVDMPVAFAPTSAGVQSAELRLNSDDVAHFPNGQFVLKLLGTGKAADPNEPADEDDTGADEGADNGGDATGDNEEPGDDTGDDTPEDSGDGAGQTADENADATDDAQEDNDAGNANADADDTGADTTEDAATDEVAEVGRFVGSPCGAGMGFAPLACMALMVRGSRRTRRD